VRAAGLADYGKPGNYFERQIGRWSKQYQASITEPIAEMDKLIEWLPATSRRRAGRRRRCPWCMATTGSTT
jgi:aminoglycoside phosphotransferase (APT) family kinase protein